ncbi:hypothetical protein L1987_31354 [Smallanthus sonchifolius]|uniref:Uncharacterized protein n=1 Tax=Smallanthus sonchifolius TaxID=185202 RepID=A0ACB9I5D9_9ASTR|nr:hypothetical protein L1987_31354 [Smallanthus sonchifolius]
MRPVDLCHFFSLLLAQKETNFLPPFLVAEGEVMMMWKPSSKQRKINREAGVSMEYHKIDKFKDSLNFGDQKKPVNNMQQQSPLKKQVRRRRHTSKPYQQRLLNMAEARREIATALKFHRASMKQPQTATNHHYPEQSPSTTTTTAAANWPISTAIPPPIPPFSHENFDFTLPTRTLGLNLNFQDFKILDTNLYHNPMSNYPSSSFSSSSSPSASSSVISLTTTEEVAVGMLDEELVAASANTASSSSTSSSSTSGGGALINGGLHHAMDDEGMEEIRSLGEQHQMEWNDTVNLVTSARWFEFLKTIEIEQEDGKFDQDMEFPHCLDIGEIEGMDGEWLA